MEVSKYTVAIGLVAGILLLSGCFQPNGLIRTSTKEWQNVAFTNHGFSVVIPSKTCNKRYSMPSVLASSSQSYQEECKMKDVYISIHPIWCSPVIEPVYLINLHFAVLLSNSASLFCENQHEANGEFMTNNTNGFHFGTNILEGEIDAPDANCPGRYSCFRRDMQLSNGDVIVATGNLWQRQIGKPYFDEDCQTIRKILSSIQPLETGIAQRTTN